MKHLLKLYVVKKIAKLRDLMKKPLSAIFTIILTLSFLSLLWPLFTGGGSQQPLDEQGHLIYVWTVLFFSLALILMMLLQKRNALFFEEDSYYMFIGPFSNRQILAYAATDSGFQSLISGLICAVVPVFVVSVSGMGLPFLLIVAGILVSTLAINFFILMIQYVYLRDLIRDKQSQTKRLLGIGMILVIAGFIAYNFFTTSFDTQAAFKQFLVSDSFYFVPIIGWAKLVLMEAYQGKMILSLLGMGLLLLANLVLVALFINLKGNFFEKAMIDAVDFSEYYKKALAGKQDDGEGKLHAVSVRYRQKEGAIFSKNLLVLLKSRAFLTKSDITTLFVAIAFTAFVKPNYLYLCGFLVFYLMNSVSSSSLVDELKSNYIYLIPGHPFKKLIYALLIPIAKSLIFSTALLLPSLIFLKVSIPTFLLSLGVFYSLVFTFYAGNVVSVRLLKSRSNPMMETTVRTGIIFLTMIPSVLVTAIFYLITRDLATTVSALVPIVIGLNLVLAFLITYACKNMMNGNAYLAD